MLRIAVQSKGRLYDETMMLLEEAGIKLNKAKRTLLLSAKDFPVEVLFLRDDDIPQSVANGTADVGIVGENEYVEKGSEAELIKRLGFKNVTEFYQKIADETLDVNDILDKYLEQQRRDNDTHDEIVYRSAEGYNLQTAQEETTSKEDVLVIDQNLKGLEFKLAKCCNPIYGDDVFGFVTVSGGIKIHRSDCPNANQMRERFGYRIVKARWAGKSEGTQYPITLRVVGHDDIGIVTNITSIISKENGITLRSIGIDSNDGLFSGTLTVMVGDTGRLEALIKKLRTVKGVKQVSRN